MHGDEEAFPKPHHFEPIDVLRILQTAREKRTLVDQYHLDHCPFCAALLQRCKEKNVPILTR